MKTVGQLRDAAEEAIKLYPEGTPVGDFARGVHTLLEAHFDDDDQRITRSPAELPDWLDETIMQHRARLEELRIRLEKVEARDGS